MPFYLWSKTAASNATVDPSINFAEGQAPSSLNDSNRAAMARTAEYRDDITGSIVSGGTSTAYTVSSFQVFNTFANLNGQMIAFSPHVTNGAGPVTLNLDGLGPKALRSAPNTELLAGVILQGTPYVAVYNNSDNAFYLQGFFGNPYNVPLLGGMDFWDTIAPNSSFIFPMGQAISRTIYAAAFARWGTRFGAGDGSTTFNVPDKTGRVSAMIEASATRLTSTYFGGDSTQIGTVGTSSEKHTLASTEIPAHTHPVTDPGHGHPGSLGLLEGNSFGGSSVITSAMIGQNTFNLGFNQALSIASSTTGITVGNNTGGGNPHAIVQPTITCNYIIRII